jgi:hypothetical protein
MPQLFPRRSNTIARAILMGFALTAGAAAFTGYRVFWSPFNTQVGVPIEQPVPFSHKHHAGELRIDCRYCHASVETSRFAGMPSTETCMSCHSQVWRDAPVLEPVRASWRDNRPLKWTRVNNLPDYTFFDHHIHVARGVTCAKCHGDVGEMPLTAKGESLAMRWCLECHQHPARVTGQAQLAKLDTTRLSDCSICHR